MEHPSLGIKQHKLSHPSLLLIQESTPPPPEPPNPEPPQFESEELKDIILRVEGKIDNFIGNSLHQTVLQKEDKILDRMASILGEQP